MVSTVFHLHSRCIKNMQIGKTRGTNYDKAKKDCGGGKME